MVSCELIIKNPSGLHLRPAGLLCQEALNFPCEIHFKIRDSIANAKSVLSVLSACVKYQDQILLICNGEREEEALNYLSHLINSGLGEDIID